MADLVDELPSRRPRPPRRRRKGLRRTLAVLAVLVVVAVAAAGWLAYRGLQARDALLRAQPLVGQVQEQVTAGDADAARATLERLQRETADARSATGDPVWALATRLPEAGDDLGAVRTVAKAVDDVAQQALPPLVDVVQTLDPARLVPQGGQIDLAPLQEAAPALKQADEAVRAARDEVEAIDVAGLDRRVAGPVGEVRSGLDEAAATTATGSRAADLLPAMLGADGPRQYLVLFQNNAEVRATGGIPGAMAVLRADAGRLEIVEQASTSDFRRYDEPVLPLSDEMVRLHTNRLGEYIQNVNLTPDFPTSAQLAREMWKRQSGEEVDGVMSIDPVALSYLLGATGPLPLATGGELTADNAVPLLLSEVYADIATPRQQDLFFASAATSVFDGLTSGDADPVALVTQLARAAGERRLLVWSADEGEEARLAGTVLEGRLPETAGEHAVVGVYLNDGTGSKMSYYLRHQVRLFSGACRPDGLRDYGVRIDLESTAPADVSGLSEYVLGLPSVGRGPAADLEPGEFRTIVLVYGPAGGGVVRVRDGDGADVPFNTQAERGRPVGVVTVDLAPGEKRTLAVDVIGSAESDEAPEVRTTPGVEAVDAMTAATHCS